MFVVSMKASKKKLVIILGVVRKLSLHCLIFIYANQVAQHIHCPLYAIHVFVYKFGKRAVRFGELVSWVLRAEPKLIHDSNE